MSKKTMLDYVRESAQVMEDNIKKHKELTDSLVEEYTEHHYKNIWIVASGSSYNGAACARIFMQKCLSCQVKLISPFQFVHADHNVPETDMIFAISQSGYSKNTMAALETIRSLNRKTIVLTGDKNSDIKAYADLIIDFGVGVETVGYVTKGVSTLGLFLMLFALDAAKNTQMIDEETYQKWLHEFEKVPDMNRKVQEAFPVFFEKHMDIFTAMQNAYICACGANLGTAEEAALKIGETIQIPAFAYELEEYIHGPNLQLTPNYTVFFVDGGCASQRVYEIFKSTALVTKRNILITNDDKYRGDGVFVVPFTICEELTPLAFLAFFQMMSYEVTETLNLWKKHPLQLLMKQEVAAKTDNYQNSPLKMDMPE